MASKFENTKPVIRDHNLEGYDVRIIVDGTGITFQRKGDRHHVKKQVKVPWSMAAELGAEKMGVSFYEHLGFDE